MCPSIAVAKKKILLVKAHYKWKREMMLVPLHRICTECSLQYPKMKTYVLVRGATKPNVYDNWMVYTGVQLKSGPILIWLIYLLRFTCYITQLTCIYSKCWKWCPFISMHLSTRFTMFLATFHSVLSFFNHFRNNTFYWRLPSKFFKETLSTVGVRHFFKITFQNKYTFIHC